MEAARRVADLVRPHWKGITRICNVSDLAGIPPEGGTTNWSISLAGPLGTRYETIQRKESDGALESLTFVSPDDFSSMDIVVVEGEEVKNQSEPDGRVQTHYINPL